MFSWFEEIVILGFFKLFLVNIVIIVFFFLIFLDLICLIMLVNEVFDFGLVKIFLVFVNNLYVCKIFLFDIIFILL